MNTTTFKVHNRAPKLDRKELSVIKVLIPIWFRGADMKLAQAALKMATSLNKLIEHSASKRSFAFDFESTRDDEANKYTMGTHLSCYDEQYELTAGYFEDTVGEEIMPVEGLIAQINDIVRIDFQAGLIPVLGTTMENFHKEIIKTLGLLDGHASVVEAEISETVIRFKLQARNNHGRVFVFRLTPLDPRLNVKEQMQ